MAINVQYGDIGSALGLALRGGEALRQRYQGQQDMQFLDLVGKQQQAADAAHAQEISQALGVQKTNADLAVSQQQHDEQSQHNQAEEGLRQQQLKQQDAETQARMAQTNALNQQTHQFQQSDHNMKVQSFADKQKTEQEKDAAIATLTPEQQAVVKATGRMPYVPNNQGDPDSKAFTLIESESRRIGQQLAQHDTQAGKTLEAQLGQPVADPPDVAALRQQKAALDAELAKRSQSMIQNGTLHNAAIAQAAAQARTAAPSAPAQQPRILQTERNPQDGKIWGYDANQGRWIPLQ